ncbi:MAG: Na/Pi symporter [Bacteroidota bacterium]
MIKKIFFPILLLFLGYLLFISPIFEEVAGGVAILLFGMMLLEEGFNSFVEGPLHKWLKRLTNKLYKSLGLGFIVTALLQSSSLISVITISFISAGLIELSAGIGVIFGSNIGTTATSWLVSSFGLKINVAALAMPMLVFGIFMNFQKRKTLKGIGNVLAGLGFFLLGIYFMKNGFDSIQDSINLADYALPGFWGLVVYAFVGIIITVILQSSSAAMALILTALAAGQITYNNSLALAIGANVGTTITAVLGALGSNVAGKRLAGAHFIFNMVTGLVALIFIVPLGRLVDFIAIKVELDADSYPIKLSIFHTIFNVLGVVLMLPFIKILVRFLTRMFTERKEEKSIHHPKYLNESALAYPHSALRAVVDETKTLFKEGALTLVTYGLNLHPEDIRGKEKLKAIIKKSKETLQMDVDEIYYQDVKNIYGEIIRYTTLAESSFQLSPEMTQAFTRLKLANRTIIEVIKDIRGLRDNVNKYASSDNKAIKKEYDRLRRKMSIVIREIYSAIESDKPQKGIHKLEKLKNKAEKSDVLLDGTLHNLISDNKISSEMATSLANDSDTVSRISKKLIEAAELLYLNVDTIITNSDAEAA